MCLTGRHGRSDHLVADSGPSSGGRARVRIIADGGCPLSCGGGGRAAGAGEDGVASGVLEVRLTDPRKPRGIRHSLSSLVSALVAGVACGYSGPLAIAGAMAGCEPDVLAAHGTRKNPVPGVFEPPSASTLGRLPALLGADELEAGLSAWLAPVALDPLLAGRIAARARAGQNGKKKRRKPPAAEALREVWRTAGCGRPPGTRSWTRLSSATQAVLLERYVTIKKNGHWANRNCEAVLYVTSLDAARPAPLTCSRSSAATGRWSTCTGCDVVWREDKSHLRTGNAPQVMSALTSLVITLFRLQRVTKITAETCRNAQNPHRPLQLLALWPG